MRVLIVDDNSLTVQIGRRMITRLGWTAESAANGLQAVESCRSGQFDLVLMDGHMPVMTGAEAISAIRQLPGAIAQVPILCTSSCDSMAQRCFEAGANGFLDKPFQPEPLRQVLSRVVTGLTPLAFACAYLATTVSPKT